MLLAFEQRVERVKKFFLRTVLVREKLDVVDEQCIERAIRSLELVHLVVLKRDDHVTHESLAVFLTGGNQLKLSSFITGTPFGDAIKEANERGTVVAGTSAGASVLAEHMIAFGAGGSTPKQRMSQLSAGLGLLQGVVIDQHFEQRNRYGRLLSLVAQSPSLLGLGVDEDTAAVIYDGSRLEVIGRGAVTVVDGQNLISNAFVAKRTSPLLVSGAVLHVLPAGGQFDLTTRTLLAHQTAVPDPEVLEVRAAEAELSGVPREIASEGLSPTYKRRLRRHRSG